MIVPTGTGGPDFYSPGTRGPGKNLFGNTVLALDANTGEMQWYYQTIYHDLWDYDLPAPPNLVTIERDGREMDVVVQPAKQGYLFVLDIETGEPVFPVEERPVPPSDVPGEEAWPVQPFPIKPDPIVRLHITEDDLTDISPEAREYALERFRELRYEGLFTPPPSANRKPCFSRALAEELSGEEPLMIRRPTSSISTPMSMERRNE